MSDGHTHDPQTPDPPTTHTSELHRAALNDPVFDWANRQDFEFATRGLMHRPDDPAIHDADGRIVWHHEQFEAFLSGDAPETVHPSLWRHALLNNYRGLFKVTDDVYQVRGESLANVTFVKGATGWIVIDPLTTVEVARYALDLLIEHVEDRPITAMIYSHTHSDHFGGVKGMITDAQVEAGEVAVVAPEGFTEWVLKEQGLAAEGMPSRNAYMYGENLAPSPTGIVDTGLGQMIEGGEVSFIEPSHLVGPEGRNLTIDGVEIEFMFAPGEAPTGMHCYLPAHRTLHVADNCYMCLHNVYTIRGAFPRDAMQWADSVARSLQFADAEFLVSGHNWPVFGGDEIRTFLGQQSAGIQFMHDQTLRLMGQGYVPAEIADVIEFPPSLARLWHLRGYYGSLKHNVRGIYAYYLGWYDGNPANLDELPPRDLAARTLDYMGGIESAMERVRDDFDQGEYRWVVHLLDLIIWAEPNHAEARELAAAAHTQLGYQAENPTWRNAYLGAAQDLRRGLPEPKLPRALRDVLKGMDPLMMLQGMSVRINGPRAATSSFTVNWDVPDAGVACHSELLHGVLINRSGHDPSAAVTVRASKLLLSDLALGYAPIDQVEAQGGSVSGDAQVLDELASLLDMAPSWFPIATHDVKPGEGSKR